MRTVVNIFMVSFLVILIPYQNFAQKLKKVYPAFQEIQDEKEIEGIIYSIAQGMRQHREEYIIFHLSANKEQMDEIENDLELFFTKTNERKQHERWESICPNPSLQANWDFEIAKPTITVSDTEAEATLTFYWLINVPLLDNESINELYNPTKKNEDIWEFKKINGRWKIVNTGVFFNILKKANI